MMDTDIVRLRNHEEFSPGEFVIYALHGKCRILGIETRVLDNKTVRLYKLEVIKASFGKINRPGPAIWVPINNARTFGLRCPMNKATAEEMIQFITNRDSYLDLDMDQPWHDLQPKLEQLIKTSGAFGLTQVFTFLYALKRRLVVPASNVTKFYELVHKLFFRELSEALNEPGRILEERLSKFLINKRYPTK